MERREFLKRAAIAGAGTAGMALTSGFRFSSHREHRHHHHHHRHHHRHRDRHPGAAPPPLGQGSALGAYVNPHGRPMPEAIAAFEDKIGRRLDITRHYTHWDMPLPGRTIEWSASGGRIPLVAWASDKLGGRYVKWHSIARGDEDAWIRRQAQSVATSGIAMYLCFHHEPEDEPVAGGPADFRGAFGRVKGIFDEVGTPNVTWLVTLMASTYAGGHGGPEAWMPPSYDLV